jgi:hypothetical protein
MKRDRLDEVVRLFEIHMARNGRAAALHDLAALLLAQGSRLASGRSLPAAAVRLIGSLAFAVNADPGRAATAVRAYFASFPPDMAFLRDVVDALRIADAPTADRVPPLPRAPKAVSARLPDAARAAAAETDLVDRYEWEPWMSSLDR